MPLLAQARRELAAKRASDRLRREREEEIKVRGWHVAPKRLRTHAL